MPTERDAMSTQECNILNCGKCPSFMEDVMTYYSVKRGFHIPAFRCEQNLMIFLLKGTLLVNSKEYAGVTIQENHFILQGIGSKLELLAMTDAEYLIYRFNKPVIVCEDKYKRSIENNNIPLIYSPLPIVSSLQNFLAGMKQFIDDKLLCKELIDMKQKELNIIISTYYSDIDLATLYQPISFYTSNFHYFVMQNYLKTKTVEELAHLGGYSITTFRRIFRNMFNEPAYEWMLKRRKEAIMDDLTGTKLSISEICDKYHFDSFSHFSNFCRTNFGGSPRAIRKEAEGRYERYL